MRSTWNYVGSAPGHHAAGKIDLLTKGLRVAVSGDQRLPILNQFAHRAGQRSDRYGSLGRRLAVVGLFNQMIGLPMPTKWSRSSSLH